MPQDQDDIKGADAMKQAPTPGPLSGDDVKLKPCPFCGNDVASQGFWYGAAPSEEPRGYHVFCLECSDTDALDGPRRDTLEEAIQAWNTRLAPTAPVEASGSELADAIERVDRWANYEYTYSDTVAVGSPLSTFTAGDLRLILSAIRPQPSGETREIAKTFSRDAIRDLAEQVDLSGPHAGMIAIPLWVAKDILALLSARPAPVASGGQHSSGEVE